MLKDNILFPIENYDQTIEIWINSADPNYDLPLLDLNSQKKRLQLFYEHYFGSMSPWDENYVNRILHKDAPNDIKSSQQAMVSQFTNDAKDEKNIGYGENARPHTKEWIDNISCNVNISQFSDLIYRSENRAIIVENIDARLLPTKDVHFYDYKIGGQGYPFDNLQNSSVWVGTPIYVIGKTSDSAWSLILTPDYISWVATSAVAFASDRFVDNWQWASKLKLAAITTTQTSICDENKQFLFSAYIGSVFPAEQHDNGVKIMVPVKENAFAIIKYSILTLENINFMPLVVTRHNFANLMLELISRPYGWGNMYFYNDCSSELKNLFTPFGIFLPRQSSDQVNEGVVVDMSQAPAAERLAYLMDHGKPFMTIIYIGGHIIMYLGKYPNIHNDESQLMAMTYQNIWGLHGAAEPSGRSIIGGSVLFPMLLTYPEDENLISLADKKYFKISYLDE